MTASTSERAASTPVQFPIVEPFTGTSTANPHWKLAGSARLDGSLELTPATNNQSGTAFLDQPFSSKLGVTIDFDYSCEGAGTVGDGFSVYLIDGEQTTGPGGTGGALGYSCTKSAPNTVVAPGVTAGYVGVGFDNYGNFASPLAGSGGPGSQSNTVGVRGSGSGEEGFHWLTGTPVPGGFRGSWEAGAHVQVSVIGGRLTVRHADKNNPNGTLVIDDFDLAGASGQTRMPDTFKLGFAAGTGSATATHRIRNLTVALPVNMPLEMTGPRTAESGHQVSYDIGVRNLGPNDAPDAVVEATVPPELIDPSLILQGQNDTAPATRSPAQGLSLPVDLPSGGEATARLTGTIDSRFEGRLTCTSRITSPTRANTAEHHSGSVDTDVELPRVGIEYVQHPGWGQGDPQDARGWVISYDLTLAANQNRVHAWEVSFDVQGAVGETRVNPTQTYWFTVTRNGLDGTVLLTSPREGHSIDPGTPLTFRVQILYRSQSDAADGTLHNLRATEVTGS
ncbi:hypothetical protein [Streptomyces sp. NPDC050856]|uniref:lectin-like domain-containing protein n=1 Tax=Streptomyces sp. NPDC050856 TaxID=3154939 RepID=UPI0033E16915